MYSSRCGVRCDLCERKETVHCKGCIHMEKPFWGGICKVKQCVEEKGLHHCGQCAQFPCAVLSNMGVEQGFDPSIKIAQCKCWRDEEDHLIKG